MLLAAFIVLAELKKIPVLNPFFKVYVSFMRGTPMLVQLMIIYYGIPALIDPVFGMPIDHINFGGMRTTPERTISYDHIICFSPKEEEDFNKLADMGVKIEYQVAAYDAPVDMKKKIEQLKR